LALVLVWGNRDVLLPGGDTLTVMMLCGWDRYTDSDDGGVIDTLTVIMGVIDTLTVMMGVIDTLTVMMNE